MSKDASRKYAVGGVLIPRYYFYIVNVIIDGMKMKTDIKWRLFTAVLNFG